MKIVYTGTHGTGKSTGASYLTALLKQKYGNKSVVMLEENVRKIAKLTDLNSDTFTKLAMADQLKSELVAETLHDIIVCDRTLIDFLAYNENPIFDRNYYALAKHHLHTFNKIYFIRPDSDNITDDGFRHLDPNYQKRIDKEFESLLKYYNNVTEIRTSQILTYDYLKDLS